jgi:hypothetical protein
MFVLWGIGISNIFHNQSQMLGLAQICFLGRSSLLRRRNDYNEKSLIATANTDITKSHFISTSSYEWD